MSSESINQTQQLNPSQVQFATCNLCCETIGMFDHLIAAYFLSLCEGLRAIVRKERRNEQTGRWRAVLLQGTYTFFTTF
jgi:hypothetical protein